MPFIWHYLHPCICFSFNFISVQLSCSVVSDSLWPHGLQHARLPCPSLTLGVYPNSCPLSRWCHPTISSSVVPFSSHLQSFPALGSFQMSQFFASGGQSIGVSVSASVLPVNIQGWLMAGMLSKLHSSTSALSVGGSSAWPLGSLRACMLTGFQQDKTRPEGRGRSCIAFSHLISGVTYHHFCSCHRPG